MLKLPSRATTSTPQTPVTDAYLGPDAPIETNERGGQQSRLEFRFDLLDQNAMFALANVLHSGAIRYAPNNWRKIDVESHLNHLLMHVFAYLGGDTQDDHLEHALCRAMFALGVQLQGGPLDHSSTNKTDKTNMG